MKPNPSTPTLPTIAALVERIDADPTLSLPARRRMTSALRSFCRHLGLPADGTPAAPALLRDAAAAFNPAAAGIAPRSWANVRSGVLAALRHAAGLVPRSGPVAGASATAWEPWQAGIRSAGCHRALSRLVRWSIERGIGPEAVSDEILDDFHRHLVDETLASRPRKSHQSACRAWNEACTAIPGFPGRPVAVPRYRKTYKLAPGSLPRSFEQDLTAWLDLLAGADLLDERAPLRPLRPATLESHASDVRRFAAAAVHAGIEPEHLTRLADLARIEVFKPALAWMIRNNGGAPGPGIGNVAHTIFQMARHHAGLDADSLAALRRLVDRVDVRKGRRGMTERNRRRLHQFDDPATVLRLLDLPPRLAREAARRPASSRSAVLAQSALMIHFLQMLPIRRLNLARLRPDRHILRHRDRRGTAFLVIPAEEMKNGQPYEAPIPPDLVERLDAYLARWRPLLCSDPANPWLFPGAKGGHKHPTSITQQIGAAIRRHAGIEMHPHLFRHLATRLNLEANPGAYEDTRRLLGHASVNTTAAFYAGMETAGAVRRYDELVLGLRDPKANMVKKKRDGQRRRQGAA